MGQRSPETVELPDHQAIARLEECQRCRKAGTIIATPARAIFEQMPLIDPRGQQRVALQVHDLPIAIGRNPHVADEHAYGNPGRAVSAHYPIPTRFVVQILMLKPAPNPLISRRSAPGGPRRTQSRNPLTDFSYPLVLFRICPLMRIREAFRYFWPCA